MKMKHQIRLVLCFAPFAFLFSSCQSLQSGSAEPDKHSLAKYVAQQDDECRDIRLFRVCPSEDGNNLRREEVNLKTREVQTPEGGRLVNSFRDGDFTVIDSWGVSRKILFRRTPQFQFVSEKQSSQLTEMKNTVVELEEYIGSQLAQAGSAKDYYVRYVLAAFESGKIQLTRNVSPESLNSHTEQLSRRLGIGVLPGSGSGLATRKVDDDFLVMKTLIQQLFEKVERAESRQTQVVKMLEGLGIECARVMETSVGPVQVPVLKSNDLLRRRLAGTAVGSVFWQGWGFNAFPGYGGEKWAPIELPIN